MSIISRDNLTNGFYPFSDQKMLDLKTNWYNQSNKCYDRQTFIETAAPWFENSSMNTITGWEAFPLHDFTFGCCHYIESTCSRLNWNVQVLPWEYSTYKLMGIQETQPGELEKEIPLMITLPNWHHVGLRTNLDEILQECLDKNIDVHVDLAWLITTKNVQFNLDHPCIKSFAMSFSKYGMQWNRCGIRWSRQRTIDSITIENHYYENTNDNITSAGMHLINNLSRDYLWENYSHLNQSVCEQLNLTSTDIFHIAIDNESGNKVGIGNILNKLVQPS